MNKWPVVKLGEVLRHRKKFITIDDLTNYKRPRIRIHAQGIVIRDDVPGSIIKTKKQQVCRAGEFLVAEIDAKVGGFGIVPEALNGSIVSSHYFLFVIDETQLERKFLDYFIRTPIFYEQIVAQGSTNYAAIRPDNVLGYEIPLPPLAEQQRIVARIEELAAQIHEAKELKRQATEEVSVLLTAKISVLFDNKNHWKTVQDAVLQKKDAVRSGPFGSQLLHDEFTPSGVVAIGTRDVHTNHFELKSGWFVSQEKFQRLKRYQIFPGDVLCTIVGASIGRFCVVPDNIPLAFTTKHIQALTLNITKVYPYYVSLMLNFHRRCRESLFSQVEGSAQPSLNAGKILKTLLPLPPLPEQHRIVAELDALQAEVDALKRLQAETSDELDTLLPAVLDRAFKGEL